MEGISSALSSLGSSPVLKNALSIANIGSTGFNLYNQYKQQQYQDKLRSLSTDPAAMAKLAAGYTQPLNAGLQKGVANESQAYLAQRGLSDSPQISQEVEAQAIAPYIQNNQQQGYNLALQALGLGGGAIPPALQQQNGLSTLAKAFSNFGSGGSGSGSSDPNAALQNYLRTFGTQAPVIDPNQWNYGPEPTAPIDLSDWYAQNQSYTPAG